VKGAAETNFSGLGRILVVVGAVTLLTGLLFMALGRFPWAGRLPGDITVKRENVTVFMPLGTMLLVSLLLTLVLNVVLRLRR
jgi:hypothetical protein